MTPSVYFIVDDPEDWDLDITGAEVVSARDYITLPDKFAAGRLRIINLCRSYRYQSAGYYVSLLAGARGHTVMPGIAAIQDIRSPAVKRLAAEDLEQEIGKALSPIQSKHFTLSIYFGQNMAKRYERIALKLFNLFPAPLLRVEFVKDEKWRLQKIFLIAADGVPSDHRDFLKEAAGRFFAKKARTPRRRISRYDLAILVDPDEEDPPSDDRAIRKFIEAARSREVFAEVITRDGYGYIPQFDALFIRDTTSVNHYTYKFAQRAHAEGMVVIDDPESILRCSNKVYLAELLKRNRVSAPRTDIIHSQNMDSIADSISLPCILKKPDSAFSLGVTKAETKEEFREKARKMLGESELIIAQEYMPTDFDWRVGLINGRPFYLCRYFMAQGHWQIMNWGKETNSRYGRVQGVPLSEAPPGLLRIATRASNLVGDGLYGVDVKQTKGRFYIIEINDNPSIESGYEDQIEGDALYEVVIDEFVSRLDEITRGKAAR